MMMRSKAQLLGGRPAVTPAIAPRSTPVGMRSRLVAANVAQIPRGLDQQEDAFAKLVALSKQNQATNRPQKVRSQLPICTRLDSDRTLFLQDDDVVFRQSPALAACFPGSVKSYKETVHAGTGTVLQVRSQR